MDEYKLGRFSSDVNKILTNMEREGLQNLSVIKCPALIEDEKVAPIIPKKPKVKVSYIIPM